MTRLYTDGAEMRDIEFWDSWNFAPTVANATPFLSAYYYSVPTSYVGGIAYRILPAAISEGYIRARVRSPNLGTGILFPGILDSAGGTVAYVSLNALNKFVAVVATVGTVGTSVLAMALNIWYLIEVYFKEANAPNGRFVVKIDGNIVIDYTGDTQPGAGTTFQTIGYQTNLAGVLLVDDLAFNDIAGGVDNSWCGDGIVDKITPDNNGTHNNWHGSDGDDVNNYLLCQEYPKDDDVTYVYHDGTAAGTQQQFALSDWSGAGKSILRIYAEARARKTSSAVHTIKLGQLAAGGADVVSAGRLLYINYYERIVGDDSFINPVTVAAWTEADLDALEFVAEVG